jgi:hypothetical protein
MSILFGSTSSDPCSPISFGRRIHIHSMIGSVLLFPGFLAYFKARTTFVSACRPYFGQISKLLDSMSSDPFSPISFGRLIHIYTITESVLLFPVFFDYFEARTTFVSASRPNFGQMSILFGSTSSDPFSPISVGRRIHIHSMTGSVLSFPGFFDYFKARTTIVSVSWPGFGQMSKLHDSMSSDPFSPISFGRLIHTYSKTRLVLVFPVFWGPSTARATLVSASRLVWSLGEELVVVAGTKQIIVHSICSNTPACVACTSTDQGGIR